jgi:hypothetical protein
MIKYIRLIRQQGMMVLVAMEGVEDGEGGNHLRLIPGPCMMNMNKFVH